MDIRPVGLKTFSCYLLRVRDNACIAILRPLVLQIPLYYTFHCRDSTHMSCEDSLETRGFYQAVFTESCFYQPQREAVVQ